MAQLPLLHRLMLLPGPQRREVLASLPPAASRALQYAWRELWARPDQLAPGSPGAAPAIRGRPGLVDAIRQKKTPEPEHAMDWVIWLLLGGRGSGKTRTGAQQVIEWAQLGRQPPIALVGATSADVRDVMVCPTPQPDQSGILAISEPGFRPRYLASKRALVWPNGVTAYLYSADEPERLRGPQHGKAWADDVAAWKRTTREAAWDMLLLGLRLGDKPQVVVTTTPKPIPWLVGARTANGALGLLNDRNVMITRSRTDDNRGNLAETYLRTVVGKYEGTRLGRQELGAEILTDVEGALWKQTMFDLLRVATLEAAGVELSRIVVAIDPQASEGTGETDRPEGPETGIVIAGVGTCGCKGRGKDEEHGFVLEDVSGNFSPNDWASKAVNGSKRHGADRIIGEQNNGGVMVENTVRTVDRNASYSGVHASRGKRTRAEPIAALYEQGKVHHVGPAPELALLEDQLATWDGTGTSPNRLDALVWALTELMLVGEESVASKWARIGV